MTREEAIENLKILKEDYWDDDGYGHETKQYDDTMFALDMAIKALEQEPKPMVEIDLYSVIKQKYIEREVLDKIRAEIKALTSNRGFLSCSVDYIHEKIDAVFDKYKGESEDT